MNKILIVIPSDSEKDVFEQTLQEFVSCGGELIFTDQAEEGLTLLKREHPQVVFLDEPLSAGHYESWTGKGARIVLLCSKERQGGDFLLRPFKTDQILEKCRSILDQKIGAQMPPM